MSPRMETRATIRELFEADRWDPPYWNPEFRELDKVFRKLHARRLGDFVTFITYGQVGKRVLNPKGGVRYLQVINIRPTGIDFLVKPDRVAVGSHNDPPRSRVRADDLLFTNNGFSGTETLLGRCVAIHRDLGAVNVSQHIDVIRLSGIDPFYVAAFIKTPRFGQSQVQRLKYGVSSTELSFAQVKDIQIPPLTDKLQQQVREQYIEMAEAHDRAMARKEKLAAGGLSGDELEAAATGDAAYRKHFDDARRRHDHLLEALETVVRGDAKRLAPFQP